MDVPKDGRRMHNHPIPRMGGLAIFFGFLLSVLVFLPLSKQYRGMLLGAVIIVILGIFDDIYALPAKPKFLVQIVAALIAVHAGLPHLYPVQHQHLQQRPLPGCWAGCPSPLPCSGSWASPTR